MSHTQIIKIGQIVTPKFELGAGLEHAGYDYPRSLVVTEKDGMYGVIPIEPPPNDRYYFCVDRSLKSPVYFYQEYLKVPDSKHQIGDFITLRYALCIGASVPSGDTIEVKSTVIAINGETFIVYPCKPAPNGFEYHYILDGQYKVYEA